MPRPRAETDVIVDFAFEDGLLFVELRNLGSAPALKVACTFDKQFRGLGGARVMNELRLFRNVEFLAPGRAIRTLLDTSAAKSAGFAEVVVGDAEIDVVEYREGTDLLSSTRKLPGRVRYGNTVLRRGITQDLDLYEWFSAIRDGDLQRRNVVIVLQDASHADVRRWLLRDAWVVKLAGPTLNAKGGEVVMEELVLACERLEIEG